MENTAIRVGELELKNRFILAPMEGVSDIGFRRLCARNGAALTYTEMIRASAIIRKNKATLDLIDTFDQDIPTGLQLFAVNERELKAALHELDRLAATTHPHFRNISAVDINFGCPSPDLIRIGAGPALLKRANKMRAMFATLSQWKSETALPIKAISAKIRLGLNQQEQDHKVYMRLIEPANECLDFLIVHARHAKQKSADAPTWSAIAEIKAASKIPIFGNGGVLSCSDAKNMLDKTKCDGIMIARGAIENPWIFKSLPECERDSNKPKGDYIPTLNDIHAAQEEYMSAATQFRTKGKYIEFHKRNFERMSEQLKK